MSDPKEPESGGSAGPASGRDPREAALFASLERLFEAAGYADEKLAEDIRRLLEENARLRRETVRLRSRMKAETGDTRHTKLREALRE